MERPIKSKLNENGAEIPDPVPMAPPLGYKKQPSLHDRIRDMVRGEHLRLAALQAGAETFDEADDFDIEDDEVDPSTPYEEQFDPVDAKIRRDLRDAEFHAQYVERMQKLGIQMETENGEAGRSSEPGTVRPTRPSEDDVSSGRDDKVDENKSKQIKKPAVRGTV